MPEDFPNYALTSMNVLPDIGKTYARTERGLIVTSNHIDPFWRGTLTTAPLGVRPDNNQHADFLAWLSRVVDLNIRVDLVHPRHPFPRSYTADTWPMSGDATLESVVDARTIEVSDLTIGLVLKRGDRLSIMQDDLVCHRWIAADTTVVSALSQNLPLTPRLPLGVFVAEASVVLKDPVMRLMVVADSWDAQEVSGPSAISFEVMESLR